MTTDTMNMREAFDRSMSDGVPGTHSRVHCSAPAGKTPRLTAADVVAAPCFTPGTSIVTPHGLVPVDRLRVGDVVETRDDGPQALEWVGAVTLSSAELAARPECRPVLIRAGALGPGRPTRDMHVSARHRVLLSHWRAELDFGTPEVLVAAEHLIDEVRITWSDGAGPVRYLTLVCEAPQIILADGIETETALPGRAERPADTLAELRGPLPGTDLPDERSTGPARPVLRGWEGRMLARAVLGAEGGAPARQARSA